MLFLTILAVLILVWETFSWSATLYVMSVNPRRVLRLSLWDKLAWPATVAFLLARWLA